MKSVVALCGAFLALALTACVSSQPMPATKVTQNTQDDKIIIHQSTHDFDTTKQKVLDALKSKNMVIFAQIDHQAAAKQVGLSMQPATVIVFGTPKVGTPLMVKDPNFALQLPLKVLITQNNGKTQVVMNRTQNVVSGSQIAFEDVKDSLAKAEGLIFNAIQ